MGEIEKLPNIGKVVAQQLSGVGIGTYAIEGAIEGIKKTQLSPEMKADLKAFYDQHKN